MARDLDPRWEPEPRVGSIRVGADGSRWRKVRRLGHEAWGDALVAALGEVRIAAIVGGNVDPRVVEAMGYQREPAAQGSGREGGGDA